MRCLCLEKAPTGTRVDIDCEFPLVITWSESSMMNSDDITNLADQRTVFESLCVYRDCSNFELILWYTGASSGMPRSINYFNHTSPFVLEEERILCINNSAIHIDKFIAEFIWFKRLVLSLNKVKFSNYEMNWKLYYLSTFLVKLDLTRWAWYFAYRSCR